MHLPYIVPPSAAYRQICSFVCLTTISPRSPPPSVATELLARAILSLPQAPALVYLVGLMNPSPIVPVMAPVLAHYQVPLLVYSEVGVLDSSF